MAKKKKKDEEQEDLDVVDNDVDEDEDDDDGEDDDGGKGGCLKKIIVFAIIIAIPLLLIKFNVFKLGDKARPVLEKVPIVKKILPPKESEQQQEEEQPLDEKDQKIEALTAEIQTLNDEINRLKVFEQEQLKFKAEKEEFDKMIALKDPKAYSSFYESINPENAEELYKQAVTKEVKDKEFKEYIQTFEGMKKDAVSTILEELITTDMDLVITILQNLSSDKRSEVLATMDPKNAAACSKLLSPETT